MNHSKTRIAIIAIVAAMALTAVAFAIPQQTLAYRHHNHNNHSNSVKVDQQINQENKCSGAPREMMKGDTNNNNFQPSSSSVDNNTSNQLSGSSSDNNANNQPSGTVCLNLGQNSAEIHR